MLDCMAVPVLTEKRLRHRDYLHVLMSAHGAGRLAVRPTLHREPLRSRDVVREQPEKSLSDKPTRRLFPGPPVFCALRMYRKVPQISKAVKRYSALSELT